MPKINAVSFSNSPVYKKLYLLNPCIIVQISLKIHPITRQ